MQLLVFIMKDTPMQHYKFQFLSNSPRFVCKFQSNMNSAPPDLFEKRALAEGFKTIILFRNFLFNKMYHTFVCGSCIIHRCYHCFLSFYCFHCMLQNATKFIIASFYILFMTIVGSQKQHNLLSKSKKLSSINIISRP